MSYQSCLFVLTIANFKADFLEISIWEVDTIVHKIVIYCGITDSHSTLLTGGITLMIWMNNIEME